MSKRDGPRFVDTLYYKDRLHLTIVHFGHKKGVSLYETTQVRFATPRSATSARPFCVL